MTAEDQRDKELEALIACAQLVGKAGRALRRRWRRPRRAPRGYPGNQLLGEVLDLGSTFVEEFLKHERKLRREKNRGR